ncbi:MAG: chloride channel protein [Chitinophagaceae bacterium]|nr:chloride channel protein [Chitinophagaceae bacterium]
MKMIRNTIKWVSTYAKQLFNTPRTTILKKHLLQALPFWIASIIAGLVAVGYTMLFNLFENIFRSLKSWSPISILFITPLAFCAGYLVVRRYAPYARGSGIPQVIASLELSSKKNSAAIDKLLSLRIVATKIVSSLLMVLGGAPIGREGPTIQMSASIFRFIDKLVPKSWPKLSPQNFIITGAAGGLAAAFNTPLGGIVFAIEELAKIHVKYFRTALFTAVILAGLTAQGILGPYLYLGYPDVARHGLLTLFTIGFVALISGLAAGSMVEFIVWIRQWKKKFRRTENILYAITIGLFIAAVGYFINDGIFGSGKDIMNTALFTVNKTVGLDTVFLRIVGPALSFNTGGAGGVFAPALAAGASVGAYISHVLDYTGTSANILILCGMVSFLTGITRTPFTSAILVFEMTDRHGVVFDLMFAGMIAYLAALVVNRHSLYEYLKKEYIPSSKIASP